VTKDKGRKTIGHGGGIPGFSTMIQRYPEQDAVVIVLSNVENANAGQIANSLASVMFGEQIQLSWDRKFVSLSEDVLRRYVGRYKLPPFVLTVTHEDGKLMVQPTNQPKVQAFAEAEGKFFVKDVDAALEFTPNGSGPASRVVVRQGDRTLEGSRVLD
jgi:hypothetical protein